MTRARGKVIRAIDGDTLWVRVRVRLRKSAPPATTQPGREAEQATARRWPEGADVTFDPHIIDDYGRFVSTLTDDRSAD